MAAEPLIELARLGGDLLDELERRRHATSRTGEQVERVARLLVAITDQPTAIQVERIKARCHVGRTRAYELRQLALNRLLSSGKKRTTECEDSLQ